MTNPPSLEQSDLVKELRDRADEKISARPNTVYPFSEVLTADADLLRRAAKALEQNTGGEAGLPAIGAEGSATLAPPSPPPVAASDEVLLDILASAVERGFTKQDVSHPFLLKQIRSGFLRSIDLSTATIISALRAAYTLGQSAKPVTEEVEDGCGCVFCDIGLDPDTEIDGAKFHHIPRRGNILCERKDEPIKVVYLSTADAKPDPRDGSWTDREKRLYDALTHAIDWIGDGCPHEGYSAMMTEAKAAKKDFALIGGA